MRFLHTRGPSTHGRGPGLPYPAGADARGLGPELPYLVRAQETRRRTAQLPLSTLASPKYSYCYFRGIANHSPHDAQPFCASFSIQAHNLRAQPAVAVHSCHTLFHVRHIQRSCAAFEPLKPLPLPLRKHGPLAEGGPPRRRRWFVQSEAA